MKLKTLLLFILGLITYLLLMLAVRQYYPDDSTQMNWQDRETFNAKVIHKLDLKADIRQEYLLSRLGSPDITEAYRLGEQVYQLLYYRTHRKAADGITTADECTALLFINRKLVAVGESATHRYQELHPNAGNRS